MGGRGIFTSPPNFCHKIRTAIDFSQNALSFNFHGQLKQDIRSLRIFLGVLVKEGSHFHLLFEKLQETKPENNMYFFCLKTPKP